MGACVVCLQQGQHADGGRLGVCWRHRRKRCSMCGRRTLGREFCSYCSASVDFKRWEFQARQPHLVEAGRLEELRELRHEKLWVASHLLHLAVEQFVMGMRTALVALYGDPGPHVDPAPAAAAAGESDVRKAA